MDLLRLTTAGNVDDGKSTLIGRLLYDTKSVYDDQVEALQDRSRRNGREDIDLALLTDGLRAEREQGITVDVAYRYFSTPRRSFILADSPGHVRYTRNMVTAASTASAAIVVIDVNNGVVDQTRRHGALLSLLRVPHIIVCVNKMDLVDYEQSSYDRVVAEFSEFAAKLDIGDMVTIPMAALQGDNVVSRSPLMPWYEGPALLHHLESVHIASDANLIDARFAVQCVIRSEPPGSRTIRSYGGQMSSGVLRVGDEIMVLPTGSRTTIAAIESASGPISETPPMMSLALQLNDDLDISRGDLLCRPQNRPTVTCDLDTTVFWMSDDIALTVESRLLLRHTTRTVKVEVVDLVYRLDIQTLHREQGTTALELNHIGRVTLRTGEPVFVDEYRRSRSTGSFILIDETTGATVGAGVIIGIPERPAVEWSKSLVSRDDRPSRGATLWITGLSASGKSSIATQVEQALVAQGRQCYVLDGDNLRHQLNSDLGFDPAGRTENVRRVGSVAQLFADAGLVAIVPIISPYAKGRADVRAAHEAAGLTFLEIFVDTSLDICESRDPKGLYRRARAGELMSMTGIDDPYEAPQNPDLRVDGAQPIATSVDHLIAFLRSATEPS